MKCRVVAIYQVVNPGRYFVPGTVLIATSAVGLNALPPVYLPALMSSHREMPPTKTLIVAGGDDSAVIADLLLPEHQHFYEGLAS
jgi:hypothetical protein